MRTDPVGIYPLKVNNRNTRTKCEIWCRSFVFIINFEHISNLVLSVSIVNFKKVNADWGSGVVKWLSVLYNFIQQSLISGFAQIQNLLAACWRFAIVRIFDNGPGWKKKVKLLS